MDSQQLAKTINAWELVGEARRSILLIGPIHNGKSTLAQLINKYQFEVKNPNLTFDKDKYILENVISTKSLKPNTVVPAVYKDPKAPDDLQIVEVPCYCLPPELKKWTPFDQKLTVNLMLERCQAVGFLIFVDEKHTRTNAQNWKKTLLGFLEIFREFPDQLLDSIGCVIAKSPSDVTDEAAIKRLQSLQQNLRNEKSFDPVLIDKLFENIKAKNRLFVFKKGTGNEEAESQEIRNIFSNLPAMCNYQSMRKNLKDSTWNNQESASLTNFIQQADARFSRILSIVKEIMGLVDHKSYRQEAIRVRDSTLSNAAELQQIGISKNIQQLLQKKPKDQDIISVIRWLQEVLLSFGKNPTEPVTLSRSLPLIAAFPFFGDTPKEIAEFQVAQEALHLNAMIREDSLFQSSNRQLAEIFGDHKNKFIEKLKGALGDNDTEPFNEAVIDLLESDSNLTATFEGLLNECKENLLKFRSPTKVIQKMIEILQQNSTERHRDAAIKIAIALQKEGFIAPAGRIFRMTKCPGDALRCMTQMPVQTQEEAIDYIEYLAQLALFETAKMKCYELSGRLSKSRGALGQCLGRVMGKQQEYIKCASGANVLLEQPILQKGQIDTIKQEARTALSHLEQR